MAEEKDNRYERFGKTYYDNHKEEILAKEKDKKRWLSYYERNKDAVKERNRAAYYKRLGREVPPPKTKPAPPVTPAPPVKPLEVKRLEELVTELRSLLPEVMKKKARPGKDRPVVMDPSGGSA
jgi:hypothetical protein